MLNLEEANDRIKLLETLLKASLPAVFCAYENCYELYPEHGHPGFSRWRHGVETKHIDDKYLNEERDPGSVNFGEVLRDAHKALNLDEDDRL